MTVLPTPTPGRAVPWVRRHLGDLGDGDPVPPSRFAGGQTAAAEALAAFDVAGYAARRNEVWPPDRRGASALSPYIRHGLLTLRRVWDHVAGGPPPDVRSYRSELLWQEYARHWYARLGPATRRPVRHDPPAVPHPEDPWDRTMACVDLAAGELEGDGWLVNQARMWLASHWTVRRAAPWADGEDLFFRRLLDGSRAANRLGWQWTSGALTGRPYGFSRRQVERRAPGLCDTCRRAEHCPIETWPEPGPVTPAAEPPNLRTDPDPAATAGPSVPARRARPEAVWLTAESLGDEDPALAAHPDLPAVFVFDAPLLARLRLSARRLVFLAETVAELAARRPVEVHRGRPAAVLAGRPVAVTHAPVPGFRRIASRVAPAEVHPWPWLVPPHGGSVASFSAWRKKIRLPGD